MQHQHKITFLIAAFAIQAAAFLFTVTPAAAQFCETRLCRDGETYRPGGEDRVGPYGVCQSSSGFGYQSHYLARCEEGWTLDMDRGICVRDACSGAVCGAQVPLCMPTERYSRSGSDRNGPYGVCEHGPAPFTLAESHRLARCMEGWSLLTETGACRRDCVIQIDPDEIGPVGPQIPGGIGPGPLKLRPDLVLTRLWLKNAFGAALKTVPAGSAYYLCYEARNIGNFPTGAFVVRGGGLGVPTPPQQNQAGLSNGASREGCLFYPVTPAAGTYTVGVTADADNAVGEANEGNNSRQIKIVVK